MSLELITEGFYAVPHTDGTVKLEVPDFVVVDEPGSPAIPVYRTWVEALAGRKVQLVSVNVEYADNRSEIRGIARHSLPYELCGCGPDWSPAQTESTHDLFFGETQIEVFSVT